VEKDDLKGANNDKIQSEHQKSKSIAKVEKEIAVETTILNGKLSINSAVGIVDRNPQDAHETSFRRATKLMKRTKDSRESSGMNSNSTSSSSNASSRNTYSGIGGILLSITLFLVIARFYCNTKYMDSICAPIAPGTILNSESEIFQDAPYWIPSSSVSSSLDVKQYVFTLLCGSRRRTRLEWRNNRRLFSTKGIFFNRNDKKLSSSSQLVLLVLDDDNNKNVKTDVLFDEKKLLSVEFDSQWFKYNDYKSFSEKKVTSPWTLFREEKQL